METTLTKKMIEDGIEEYLNSGGDIVDSLASLEYENLPIQPVNSYSGYPVGNQLVKLNLSVLPTTREGKELSVFGFDTGNRLGFAWIHNGVAVWGYTILVKDYSEHSYPNVMAFDFAYNFVRNLSALTNKIPFVIVEGSAINKRASQEFMAQIRSALFLGSYEFIRDAYNLENHRRVFQASPQLVRKIVLGNGKTDPSQKFPEYNPNAIDALTIAWYGLLRNSEDV